MWKTDNTLCLKMTLAKTGFKEGFISKWKLESDLEEMEISSLYLQNKDIPGKWKITILWKSFSTQLNLALSQLYYTILDPCPAGFMGQYRFYT